MKSNRLIAKEYLSRVAYWISPRLLINLSYFHNRLKFPNLSNPKNISEIILANIISGKVNDYVDFVDKLKVRDFLFELGFENYLPKVYYKWNSIEEINFENLPSRFALKTNNGCGSHYICKSNSSLNVLEAKTSLRKAFSNKYGLLETQYNLIIPKIYCEEFIDDETNKLPIDYKLMCCDGEIKCILVVSDRETGKAKLKTYDLNWKELDFIKDNSKSDVNFNRPKHLEQMISIAQIISSNFSFVRVDFYSTPKKLFIGELTFTPQGGIMSYFTNDAIKKIGRQ